MDEQRYRAIKEANKRLAEANAKVEALNETHDLGYLSTDFHWPEDVQTRAVAAAKAVYIEHAAREQAEAQKAWDAL